MNRAEILSPPVRDVFILDQTNPTQALLECFNERLVISVGGGTNREKSKSDRTFALLRARRSRPCRRAAEQRDEGAPLHSITSSDIRDLSRHVRFVPKPDLPTAANDAHRLAHSSRSSARISRDSGTSIPSAFATCRLTSNSILVGCSTGRSAGLVPLRIRST